MAVYGKNTVVYERKRSVFRRISPYTVTVKYDRNTVTCNTEKYGRIRSVYGMYTVVYGTVHDRLRPCTESVTIDLESGAVRSQDLVNLKERFQFLSNANLVIDAPGLHVLNSTLYMLKEAVSSLNK
jgi:hypothetical protein